MVHASRVCLSCFLLLVFSTTLLSGQEKPQWKGKIESENGVKVVKNPQEPLFGEIRFELEKELSIGNAENTNYLFYRVVDVQVDQDGNIYIVDMDNFRIQIYDDKGRYLKTLGRKGQGPGRIRVPSHCKDR